MLNESKEMTYLVLDALIENVELRLVRMIEEYRKLDDESLLCAKLKTNSNAVERCA